MYEYIIYISNFVRLANDAARECDAIRRTIAASLSSSSPYDGDGVAAVTMTTTAASREGDVDACECDAIRRTIAASLSSSSPYDGDGVRGDDDDDRHVAVITARAMSTLASATADDCGLPLLVLPLRRRRRPR
jgi:hypothetical protein